MEQLFEREVLLVVFDSRGVDHDSEELLFRLHRHNRAHTVAVLGAVVNLDPIACKGDLEVSTVT